MPGYRVYIKKYLSLLALVFVLMSQCTMVVSAASGTYVQDDAGLLSESEASALEARAAQISSQYNCGVYVVTTPDMADEGYGFIEQYAEYVFYDRQLGVGPDRNMVLLVISMAERDYDIEAYGPIANSAFTDYGKDKMADRVVPYMSDGDFAGAFGAYIDTSEQYLSMFAEGTPFDVNTDPSRQNAKRGLQFGGPVIGGLIAALGSVFSQKSKMKSAKAAVVADRYVTAEGLRLSVNRDVFVNRLVTRTPIPKKSSGGDGGGGTTINSGGFSHNSGKF